MESHYTSIYVLLLLTRYTFEVSQIQMLPTNNIYGSFLKTFTYVGIHYCLPVDL